MSIWPLSRESLDQVDEKLPVWNGSGLKDWLSGEESTEPWSSQRRSRKVVSTLPQPFAFRRRCADRKDTAAALRMVSSGEGLEQGDTLLTSTNRWLDQLQGNTLEQEPENAWLSMCENLDAELMLQQHPPPQHGTHQQTPDDRPVHNQDEDEDIDMDPVALLQPGTRPISHDQLVVEVKAIYTGLVMVESKCMDVDDKQSKTALKKGISNRNKLKNDQWQALMHLHTLLHEHHDCHDCNLASQHPLASPTLSELAHRYSMPTRLWRHANHAFPKYADVNGPYSEAALDKNTSDHTRLGANVARRKPPEASSDLNKQPWSHIKVKQGLPGYVNGENVAALADTGSRKNVISAAYASRLGLQITGSSSTFELGNSRKAKSIGTVSLSWAFAGSREETTIIMCHVLPNCIYDLILGNGFLKTTETLSRYRHRLTECFFTVLSKFAHFGYLGDESQRLHGTLADEYDVLAIPDTGAERNVMDLEYAIKMGFEIEKNENYREYLQFADGTVQETAGRVTTFWTFDSREIIPISFEVLEGCCSDIVIGEDILRNHNVFEDHASSIVDVPCESDYYELTPFDFYREWQQTYRKLSRKLSSKQARKGPQGQGLASAGMQNSAYDRQAEDQRRREIWDFTYDFGARASSGEKEVEKLRRARYASGQASGKESQPHRNRSEASRSPTSERRTPMIPTIPTAQSRRQPSGR